MCPLSPAEDDAAFSQDEVNDFREIFDLFDKNKSGAIDVQDLEHILESLNRNPAEGRRERVSQSQRSKSSQAWTQTKTAK